MQYLSSAQMLQSPEALSLALEASQMGIWSYEFKTQMVSWSEQVYQIYGIEPSSAPFYYEEYLKLLHPDDVKVLMDNVNEAIVTGSNFYRVEHRIIAKGAVRWLEGRGRVYVDDAGIPVAMMGTVLDITQRKTTEDFLRLTQERLQLALAPANIGYFDWKMSETEVFWDQRMKEIFELPADFAGSVNDYLASIVHPEDRQAFIEGLVNTIAYPPQGGIFHSEYRIISPSGIQKHIAAIGKMSLDANGAAERIAGICQDVSQQKNTELALEKQNQELIKLNEELDNFVYRVSHDLRAPITSALGLLSLMKRQPVDDTTQVYIDLQDKSLKKLDSFIKDILDYSRNSRMEVNATLIDFHEILNEVFAQLDNMDEGIPLQKVVTVEGVHSFFSDPKRLLIIFNNLVSNAFRFKNAYQEAPFLRINIKIESAQAIVEVSDNGIGIEEEHLARIFEMFYRASTQRTGSGLGLYILKEATDKLKGTVRVSSTFGDGTIFTFNLPNLQQDSL